MPHWKRISVKSSASVEVEIKSFILAKKAKGLTDKTFAEAAWEEEFRHYLPYIRDDDFLGVQNYTRTQYGPEGQLPCPEGAELTQMDYEFYPEALEHVIRRVHEDFGGIHPPGAAGRFQLCERRHPRQGLHVLEPDGQL